MYTENQRQPVNQSCAPDIVAQLINSDAWHAPHIDRVQYDANHPHVRALPQTARDFLKHIVKNVNAGQRDTHSPHAHSIHDEHSIPAETPLTESRLTHFVRHRENLVNGFNGYLNELLIRFDRKNPVQHAALIRELETVSAKLAHLHNVCEIARHKALTVDYANQPEHHERIHAMHDEIATNIQALHEQIRARVAADLGHELPDFEIAAYRAFNEQTDDGHDNIQLDPNEVAAILARSGLGSSAIRHPAAPPNTYEEPSASVNKSSPWGDDDEVIKLFTTPTPRQPSKPTLH